MSTAFKKQPEDKQNPNSANQLVVFKDPKKAIEKHSDKQKLLSDLFKNSKSADQSKKMEILLEQGHLTEIEVADALGKEYGYEVIKNLNDYVIEKPVLELIPKKVCEQNLVLPLVRFDKTLIVVFANPANMNLIDNLSLITGLKIQPVVSTRSSIKDSFNRLFDNEVVIDNLVYNMSVDVEEEDENLAINLNKEKDNKDHVVSFVNLIFNDAIRLKCSDVHVETYETSFRIRYRVDGVLYEKHRLAKEMASVIISRIKIMSGMDISEKRKPQDARLKVVLGNTELSMRVNSTPTVNGEKLVLRILDNSGLQSDMRKLGMETFQLDAFSKYLKAPQGMILMTGPTGSGKSTTIYSGLLQLNTPDTNISTAEDPVEYRIHGINQLQINPKAGLDFSSALRAFLRQDPDVILIGEIRDLETADIAFKASATGHLVLSTLHTNDTASTITRLLSMGVPSYSVADNTSLIISQRLLRSLCDECKVLANSTYIKNLTDIGVTQDKIKLYMDKLYIKNENGCNYCNQMGYKGRIAIYEIMEVTKTIKRGIFDKLSPVDLKNQAIQKDNLVSLRQAALLKLQAGLTTVEEVLRVTVPD